MAVETLKIQLTLNAQNETERQLIEYLNETGKRSGAPKQLMIMGFKSLPPALKGEPETVKAEPVKATSSPNLKGFMS